MAIDVEKAKALKLDPLIVDVERGRLRLFARVIEETDPVYVHVDAARAAGHRDLPVPPTFFFSLGLEAPEPFHYLNQLGIDLQHVLHGEQSFTYDRLAYAGDRLTLQDRIVDVFVKRGGALEFLIKETDVTRNGEFVARARTTIVVRNTEVPR